MTTIETTITISALLLIIVISLTALFNNFNEIIVYCSEMTEITTEENGDDLRLKKVLKETGGEIADGILQKYKE